MPRGLMAGQGAVAAAERRKLLEYSDGGRVLSCVGAWVVFALLVGVSWAEPNGYMMLVPDSVIVGVVVARLQEPDCTERGWLLDGFPRSAAQRGGARHPMHPSVGS